MGVGDGAELLEEVCVADQAAPWQLHIKEENWVQAQVRHVAPEPTTRYLASGSGRICIFTALGRSPGPPSPRPPSPCHVA